MGGLRDGYMYMYRARFREFIPLFQDHSGSGCYPSFRGCSTDGHYHGLIAVLSLRWSQKKKPLRYSSSVFSE